MILSLILRASLICDIGVSAEIAPGLAVDFFSMSDPNGQDDQASVLKLADDPEIAHPATPQFSEARAEKGLSDAARIFRFCNSLSEKFQNAFGMLGIKLG
jgi:hypothetical protein